MAATPGSQSFGKLLDEMRRIAEDNHILLNGDATTVTGPKLLGRMLEYMQDCSVAPASLFAPLVAWDNPHISDACASPPSDAVRELCNAGRNETLLNLVYTVHHWSHSWNGDKWRKRI